MVTTGKSRCRDIYLFQISLVLVLLAAVYINSEQVNKFYYKGQFAPLNNATLVLPERTVAMGEYVFVNSFIDSMHQGDPCSIMFVVDMSASNIPETDPNGIRMQATSIVLDSIYKRNRSVRVGLIFFRSELFFYPKDDPLFKQPAGYSGGYIPPLNLDSNYSGVYTLANVSMEWSGGSSSGIKSQTPYTKKGIDVLKMYLETRTFSALGGTYVFPKYFPSPPTGSSQWIGAQPMTNITAAFDAAKIALSNPPYVYPPARRFIIFYSDGYATEGGDGYMQGTNVPTTFTIYYGNYQEDIVKLQTMTTNIKNNGFSTSNPKFTNIWKLQMNQDALIKLLVNDILSKIIQTSNNTPINIVVNTQQNTVWDSIGFLYKRMFPLQKTETPFNFKINYRIKKDSITETGQVITISVKDTLIDVNCKVQVQVGAPLPPNITQKWWGRNLGFFYNNDTVKSVNDTMKTLEVRFSEYKVDTVYGYDSVLVTLTTSIAPADAETLRLAKNGTYFTAQFPRVTANPTLWNNILEHQKKDSIIAIFRNSFLPLDTMRIAVPFYSGYPYVVNKAIYFDNNADGHVDSVYAGVAGEKFAENGHLLIDKIPLPAHRQMQINSSKLLAAGFGYSVTEKRPDIQTFVTDTDVIAIKDTIKINVDVCILPCSVKIEDSMAPVVMSASYVDSIKQGARKELTVVFSENVKTITDNQPFLFYSAGTIQNFNATMNVLSQNNTTGLFSVLAITPVQRINDGDSIWIYPPKVSDNLNNAQDNPKNIKRPIAVRIVDDLIRLEKASLHDNNADGFVDSIFIGIGSEEIRKNLSGIMSEIVYPAARNITTVDYAYSPVGIGVHVREGSGIVKTFVTAEDRIALSDTVVLSPGFKMAPSQVACEDRMAPVVMSASFIDSVKPGARDELTVILSEPVTSITETNPYVYLYTAQQQVYDGSLNLITQSGATGVFSVLSVTSPIKTIKDGDSIRINAGISNKIADNQGNRQANSNNIRRRITVTLVEEGLKMSRAVYFDNNADGHVDSLFIQVYGDRIKDHIPDFLKVLKLPAYRSLTIQQSGYTAGGVGLRVVENMSETHTDVNDQDIAVIENKVVLPDSVIILPASVKIQDAMAPVIMSAALIDSMIYVIQDDATDSLTTLGTDELTVVFSEPVDKILPSAPFNLYATQKNNKEYEIELSVKSQAGNTAQFIIKSVTGENSVTNGDSIRIYGSSQKNVSDTLDNNQSNPDNVKRVVNVQIIVKKILIALPFDLIMKATLFEPGKEYDLSTIAGVPEIQEMLKTVARRSSGKYKDIMILTIEPDNSKNLFKENEYLTGEIAGMYDALGNVILSGGKQMYYYKPWKKLIYIWDGRNTGGRMVGSSTYIVFAKAERKARGNLTYLGKFQTEWALKKPVGVVEK